MISQSSIVKKMNTLFDETIHITPKCVVHLHGHQNKMVLLLKPFIFTVINNGIKFHNCTCWSANDTQSHRLSRRVNNHHIANKNLVFWVM
jgi:hypothetical protein